MVFRVYGIVCLVFLVLFVAVNFATHNEGAGGAGADGEDLNIGPLGPHGVPSAPHGMPRALSSSKLEEDGEEALDTSGPNLGVPGQRKEW